LPKWAQRNSSSGGIAGSLDLLSFFQECTPCLLQKETGRVVCQAALELIAYSSPHNAELFADCGAETESGTALCNGIGKGHIMVVDIDE
jgi:hypothetical protein